MSRTSRVIQPSIKKILFRKYGGHCSYCGKVLDPFDDYVVDHLIPVSKGGSDDPDNLMLSCHPCNATKRDKLLEDFRQVTKSKIIKYISLAIALTENCESLDQDKVIKHLEDSILEISTSPPRSFFFETYTEEDRITYEKAHPIRKRALGQKAQEFELAVRYPNSVPGSPLPSLSQKSLRRVK